MIEVHTHLKRLPSHLVLAPSVNVAVPMIRLEITGGATTESG